MFRTDRCVAVLAFVAALGAGIAHAQEASQGRLSGLKLSGNQPIQIESDKLEVRDADKIAIFSGNVSVVQGETLLKSGVMTVYYAEGGGSAATGSANIDRLEVAGTVYVKSGNQVATGDKGVFNMKTEILTLTGKEVVLSEGPNVLVGCQMTVNMASGEAQVQGCSGGKGAGSGRVIMSITPGSQSGSQSSQ